MSADRTTDATSPAGLPLPSLQRWAQRCPHPTIAGLRGPLTAAQIAGGRSNITYLLEDSAGAAVIIRRPPLGDHPATAHDVLREAKMIGAVRGSVPVPEILAAVADPSVIGAPFVVMERVPGLVVRAPSTAAALPAAVRADLGPRLVRTLAGLSSIDPATLGFDHLLGRRDFVERQVRRWLDTVARTSPRSLSAFEDGGRELLARGSAQQRIGLVHGDFRLDNCIVAPDGEIRAVLDWELSTIGDPVADMGQLLAYWAEPGDAVVLLVDPPTQVGGFSTRAELADAYLEHAPGVSADELDYFVAFTTWKIACITENVYSRVLAGAMGEVDRTPDEFAAQAEQVAGFALDRIRALPMPD